MWLVCLWFQAIKLGVIPPTINYETPDPDCDLDYVPNKAIKYDINVAISENLGASCRVGALLASKAFNI